MEHEPDIMSTLKGMVHQTSNGTAVVVVQESVYSLEALFRTCYLFTDRCYLFLKRVDRESIEVHITAKNEATGLDALVGEFCNQLIDQRVRADISRESGKIREIIVAQAFAEGNLLDALGTTPGRDDYNEDPLGIGDSSEHTNS